jgi:hypothetical protein
VVPVEGREATLKGVLLCSFVGSLPSSAPMEDRSASVWTQEKFHKETSMFPKQVGQTLDEFGSRSDIGIQQNHSTLATVQTIKRQATFAEHSPLPWFLGKVLKFLNQKTFSQAWSKLSTLKVRYS